MHELLDRSVAHLKYIFPPHPRLRRAEFFILTRWSFVLHILYDLRSGPRAFLVMHPE